MRTVKEQEKLVTGRGGQQEGGRIRETRQARRLADWQMKRKCQDRKIMNIARGAGESTKRAKG